MLHNDKMCKHSSCVSYMSCCCDQSLTRSNAKEGELILLSNLTGLLHCGRKDMGTRARDLLVTPHQQSGCRDRLMIMFLLKHSETPAHEMVLPVFRVGLLT